jgi:hypothetical protein
MLKTPGINYAVQDENVRDIVVQDINIAEVPG